MSGIKRMALLFLTLVLLMGVFAGCSSYRKGDETLIMTVGGYEVTGEIYRYVCMKNCVQLYGAEALERPLIEREEQELQSAVETELQRYFAIENGRGTKGGAVEGRQAIDQGSVGRSQRKL